MKIPDFVKTYLPEPDELIQISDHIFGLENKIEEQKKDSISKKKIIYLFSGLSGSGKDTIVEHLMTINQRLKRVRTCTTRLRRPEESEYDDPYIRITKEELKEMLLKGEALEYVEYAGNNYCTSKYEIQQILDSNHIPVLRVDPQGCRFFIEAWRNKMEIFKDVTFKYFFIVPSSFQDLRERLIKRGSSDALVDERIEQSRKDITFIGDTQYVVVNEFGQLDKVIDEVKAILR